MYPHGATARCRTKSCKDINAPLQCVGCNLVVEEDLMGVLSFEMELIPYESVRSEIEKEDKAG
jgi:hypothetical protein